MSFYDEIREMTEQGKKDKERDKEIYFKGTVEAAERNIAEAARAGETETIFYGDYDYANPKDIKAIFEKQGFKCCIVSSLVAGGWKIIFSWK